MKRVLISAIAVAALASPVLAADLPVKAPAYKAPPPAVYSWTGCYIAGGGTYGLWDQRIQALDTAGNAAGLRNDNGGRGWGGTAQVGCDYQFAGGLFGANLVIGAFGDYDWTDYKGDGVFSAAVAGVGDVRGREKMKSAWAAGGRVGLVPSGLPQLLVYVSGGWTEARFSQVNLVNGFTGVAIGTFLPRHTYTGFFVGSGFEYALGWLPGLFWKTEYRWSEFDRDRIPELSVTTGIPNGFSKDSEKWVQTIRSELVWRFNWGGAVSARY